MCDGTKDGTLDGRKVRGKNQFFRSSSVKHGLANF